MYELKSVKPYVIGLDWWYQSVFGIVDSRVKSSHHRHQDAGYEKVEDYVQASATL
jgi:hypothetical protein